MADKIPEVNIERRISTILAIQLSQWGNELVIQGRDDPIDCNVYVFTFRNCKLINWYLNEPDQEDLNSPESTLIDLSLGEDNFRSPAVITLDVCEISVLYESAEIQRK
ncbi:MAG: hypothetical protein R2684_11110 [Pyrinomonadaceae bacterium]